MFEDIKDRGIIKWQGLMLTEHVTAVQQWREKDNQVVRPQLDEFELELIADEILRAYKSKASVKLIYWRDGFLKADYGKIISIDNKSKSIVLDDPFTTTRYPFDEIVAVSLIGEGD